MNLPGVCSHTFGGREWIVLGTTHRILHSEVDDGPEGFRWPCVACAIYFHVLLVAVSARRCAGDTNGRKRKPVPPGGAMAPPDGRVGQRPVFQRAFAGERRAEGEVCVRGSGPGHSGFES